MSQNLALKAIKESAKRVGFVEVLWLYGSRARGDAQPDSDYDFAVAFKEGNVSDQAIEALQAAFEQSIAEKVSVVDVNKIPVTLAINVMEDGRVIYCASDVRLLMEQQRIWSKWEYVSFEARKFPNEL